MSDPQRQEGEAHENEWLGKGKCPYSGEELRPLMDIWNRRVLMCEMCDCFGYPVVVSDIPSSTYNHYDPPDLTGVELKW